MMYYVTMTDNFFSGWGPAEGKTNKLIIICSNYDQASQLAEHALNRGEMKYVNICVDKPYYNKASIYSSWKDYNEMGGCWIEQGGRIAA